ncbi:uncharacterized protein J3D65DRAFT_661367 [Phyllosticta citribraziliensis]|uniref:Uncharacterized protein n=1 Tax=Phyllosticta citribraziliensis TaxID=989973 RepID=A0ABR1LEL6_9PEZI
MGSPTQELVEMDGAACRNLPPALLHGHTLAQLPDFLNPTKVSQEIRDSIYDIVIKDTLARGTYICAADGTWRLAYLCRQPEGLTTRSFPSLLGACKQTREEFLERIYAKLGFLIEVVNHDEINFQYGIPNQISITPLSKIRHLCLQVHVEPATELSFKASDNGFIKEPYSIRYTASGRLSEAKLIRSAESLSPTGFWDVKKYGIHGNQSLPQLVQAEEISVLPTEYNSKLGQSLGRFLKMLAEGNNLMSLDLKVVLPMTPRSSFPARITASSGMNAFMRPLETMDQIRDVSISVQGHREFQSEGKDVQMFLEADAERITDLLKSNRQGCNISHETLCFCEKCFPPLRSRKEWDEGKEEQAYSQDDKNDEAYIEYEIEKIIHKKRELADDREYFDPEDVFPAHHSENAHGEKSRFCVGIQDHDSEDEFGCSCPECNIGRAQW